MAAQGKKPLLLESGGRKENEDLGLWRAKQELIDALPYVDPLPTEVRAKVEGLIKAEMRRMDTSAKDYEDKLPPVPESKLGPLTQQELARIEAAKTDRDKHMPKMDERRYRVEPPPEDKQDSVEAWQDAVSNARAQSEHQQLKLLNLRLQSKFGADVWRGRNMELEQLKEEYETEARATKKETEALNRVRKLEQEAAGGKIEALHAEFMELVRKNAEIADACAEVERDVALYEARARALERRRDEQNGGGAMEED
ncbi:unnamed protein product [Pedinophyceae sp. YPF-701]|nr:unnamed protein product [Pedinophyceae sp. YPF-701]